MEHLPPDAALHRGEPGAPAFGWGVTEYLLADVFHALTGEAHPSRPSADTRAERHKQLRQRLQEQRARLAAS